MKTAASANRKAATAMGGICSTENRIATGVPAQSAAVNNVSRADAIPSGTDSWRNCGSWFWIDMIVGYSV